MKFLKLFLQAGLFGMLAIAVNAQSTVGTIYGSVSDASGAKLPAAYVTITDVKTKSQQKSKTNSHGDYTFVAVNPSNYQVTVSMQGFKTSTQTGVTVDANQNVDVSFTMALGEANETVEVTAGTTMVDTREAQIGETIDEQRIEELPTINRDPYELLQTVTGVSGYSEDIVIGSRDGANFSVNGFPLNTSSFYLDGAQNNALKGGGGNKAPNPSALQEFRILTSNFDAEFGRSPGAVANLITKSGTDQMHGQVYEFVRNDAFDAKPYFTDPGTNVPFKQNQFGAAFGGPIPKLRQTFFFTSFEELQLHTNQIISARQVTYPTTLEAMGDFTNSPAVNVKAFSCTGTTNVICPNFLDPVAVKVMTFIPKADPVTGTAPAQSAPANNLVNQGLLRIDYNGFQRHSIEGTFFDSRGSNADPSANGTNTVYSYAGMFNDQNQVNAILADNWILSNNAVNSVRVFYTQNRFIITNIFSNHLLPDLGAAIPAGGTIASPPRFNFGNNILQAGPTGAGPSDINQLSFGIVDVASLTYGRHSIKIGGSYIWDKYSENGANQAGGSFTIGTGTGSPYSDFLLGRASGFTQSNSSVQRKHNYDPALFVQDNWHFLPRLTLNLGLRWEVYPPFQGDGNSGTFRAGVQSTRFPTAPVGILFEGDRGVAPGIANTSYTKFAPRVGFAWDVYGDGRTSLRGGYGIFFYQQVENDEGLRIQQPFGLTETINGVTSYVDPYASSIVGHTPFPYHPDLSNPTFITNGTVYASPRDGGTNPYAQEYNLSVEQQLTKTYALRVSYVGSSFIKQLINIDINTPVYGTGSVVSRRPYQPYGLNSAFTFGPIQDLQNAENTHYNSLQVTLRGRLGRKINLNTSYVWAKALNYIDPTDDLDLHSSYGPANVDIRNRFVLSGLFALPTTQRFGFFGKQVLSGWRLNDITYIQSGTPFTITTSNDLNANGNLNDRPNLIGDPYTHAKTRAAKITAYINPAAFQYNAATGLPAGTLAGSEKRNSLNLPSTTATNVSLFKEFAMPHSTRLQIRAEAFNVFGNVNFNQIRTVINVIATSPTQLLNSGPSRRLQFGGRYFF